MRKKFLLMIFVLSLFTSMGGGWLHAQTENGVSKIGDTPYNSLAEAVTAATAGQTITLIADVELTEMVTIPEGKELTLDLNGKKVTHQDEATKYAINNLGTLTIQDTKGNGSINARGIYNGYGDGAANVATAKITVLSGTINAKGTNGGAAVYNYGIAEIKGGTFTSIGGYSLNSQSGASMTIADGVTANNGIYVSGATLVVDGGKISGNRSGCHVLYAWNSTVTIKGGEFYNNNSGNSTTMAGGTTKLTINGGTFSIANGKSTTGWTSCLIDATDGGKYEINGGEFKGHFRVQANCAMEINGGTFENTHGEAYVNGGTVAVKGGTFTDAAAQKFATDNLAAGYELGANGTVAEVVPAAKIGETPYTSFADALNAAKSMTGDVTVEIYEKVTMNQALAGSYNSINFVGKDTDAEIYLDVQGYTTATGKKVAFKDLKLSKSEGRFINNAGFMNVAFGIYDVVEVTYTNCTFENGACASSGKVTYTECTFKKSWDKYGLWAYGDVDITVDGCIFADYRGIKMYAENGANASVEKPNLVVKNTDFSAVDNKPAIVLTYGESVQLAGNTYSTTGVFELDLDGKPNGVAVTSDVAPTCINDNGACGVLVDGKIYTTVAQAAEVATSGSTVKLLHNSTETVEFPMGVTLEKNGFDADGVTVVVPVAQIGTTPYTTLEAAFAAATSGCTIDILSDVTVDSKWDCRYTGSKFTVPVTINGNGKTIKFTASVNDNNWNTIFRFEENATVNNLTVDIANATGAQRVISAKKSLNVDGLNIVGSARYGVIYGEGANAADLAATEIVVKNSTLGATRRAVSDNEGGKDVKSVVIEGNTFNANVYVSASESIAFNKNTVNGETDLRSYAADNVLNVKAQENTLAADKKNYIYAKTIVAQEGFETKKPPLKVSNKAELDAALAAAQDGDIIVMTADIDYGTSYTTINKAITLDLGGKILTTSMSHGSIRLNGGCTLKNGTLNHNGGVAALKVWDAAAIENLVINVAYRQGSTIGGIVIQENAKGVASIKNVTIQGEGLTNGIETYNCGNATENVIGAMENVTINAQGTGMLISAPCGTATNCDIKGGVNGIEIWIKGNYSASLDLVASKVEGGVYAHDEFNNNPDVVNNGKLSLTADNATTGAGLEDVTLTIARAEAENVKGVLKDVMEAAQAKIGDTYYTTIEKAFNAAQAGQTVTILKAGTYPVPSGKDLTITGDVDGVVFANIGAHNMGGANVTFNNVTFTYTNNSTYKGLQHSGNLVYNNCTFNGQVFLYGASETFNNCTFNTTDSNNYNVWTYGAKEVAFNGCTFYCAGKSVLIYNESPSVNNNVAVTNSKFIASQAVEGKAAIEMDSSLQGTINLTIDGETTATGFAAGNVSGNSLWNNKKDNNDITVVVNNETVLAPINGDGTEDNPYLINNVRELVAFRKSVNAGKTEFNAPGVWVALNADIDLDNEEWTVGIGDGHNYSFDGNFDGKNYTIKNLNIKPYADADNYICGGLFGYTFGSVTIKNLVIENAKVNFATAEAGKEYHNVGVLVGFANNKDGKLNIDNVIVKGDIKVDAPQTYGVGAIVGYSYREMGTITNTKVIANDGSYINGQRYVGGITGYSYDNAVITKCIVNNLALTGEIGVGGIAGLAKNGNNIAECTVTNVTVNGDKNVAYIVGELQGEGGSVIIADNNNAPQPWVGGSWGSGEPFVATIGTKYYTSIKDAIKAVKDNETIVLIRDITMDYNARDSYETQTQNIVIDGNDHTLTLNQKNSDWASIGLANNSKLVLNNMTIEKTGYGDTNGAWNTHAIIFSCPLEMNDVIVNNSMAVQAGAILNNVAIKEDNGYYGLWINGNGQSVTMNGGSITATNGGRGIKIADQYIDAPAQVKLNVTGTDFNTAKKAAVLVSSKAGAEITASNVNIENVAEDTVNFVWVDEDWAANFGNVEVTGAKVAQEGIEKFVAAVKKDAKVEGYYASLQAAVNAVQNGETITLIKDVTENVTLTEKTGLYYTIDGAGKTMNGTITVKALSDTNDNRRITIKDIKFVDTVNGRDFITSTETNHYPRLTVEGCSFTGTGKEAANTVAIRLKSSHSVVISNCTGTGLHSFLQNTSGWNLTIENVTVTESKSGLALGTVQGVTVKDSNIDVAGYGIRMDAQYNNNAVIESNTVNAFIPVVVRKAEVNSNVTFNGTNTMTATNTDGYWCVIGATEYEENGQLPTTDTGKVIVNLNDEGLSYEGVYGNYAVAQIGDVKYATLQAAVNAVEDGDIITLIADEVFTKNNRYNNNGYWDGLGYSGDKSFTIDLAEKTIKQDGALNDYLIWIKNDGSKDNTINIINGTIDAGKTAYCALATASSNINKITINTSDINFVGNNSSGAVLKIRGGAELNANAGTIITGKNNYVGIEVVGTNTVVNINEGVEIYQNGTSSYVGSLAGVSYGATLNVIGGKGTSAQGGFIAMTSGGTINVSGGEWIANTYGTYANGNKSVLIAQSDKQYNAGAGNSIVNVTGGTFKGGYNCYGNAVGDAQINIKGGNFNANPTTYVVDKYEVVEEANGTFTVKMASFEKFYTATGVETTTGGVFSLAFEPTSETEVSVKIGRKNPAENKNYDLIIPSSVEFDGVTYAVTSIPEEGFKGCKGFDKLVVPGTITSVSASAFYNCSRLKEIKIEEGVQKLGKESFYKISDLKSLTLPSTLTRIESLCFRSTEDIETIICNAQTPPTAFDGCFTATVYKNALVYVAGEYEDYKAATGWKNFNNIIAVGATQVIVKKNYTLIATITDVWNRTCSVEIGTAPTNTKRAQLEIPEHVSFSSIEFDITSIPESGFQDCKYFEGTLTIPAYITSIGKNAFNGCSYITELVVEEGVVSLGTDGTFNDCYRLKTITLPSTLKTIPVRCFYNIQQNLNTIVCNAMTPPTLGSNFTDVVNKGVTLYVHDVDAYKAAARWNLIKSIRLIGAVAQNMTTSREYKSLQEAINEAAGATVKVLDNVVLEEAITVAAGAEVTLDLNGKVVSYESAVVGEDMITNNGKLTVESSVAGGKITYNNTDETGSNVTISTISTVAGSELIINGGIIENTSLANYSSRVLVPYAIDILTNGNLGDVNVTINGGEIVSTKYIAIRQFVNGNVCNNSLTVKDGTITGLKRAINVQDAQGNGQVKNCAKLFVEAGNIIAGEGGYAICNFANSENVALTGGNFVGTVYSAIEGIISGGTFSEEPYSGYLADGFICEPNADGTYSVIEEPIYTQTIQLKAGWNWFSSYVETDLDSLQNALGENGVMIKNHHHGYTENEDGEWWGTLDTFDSEQMYLIKINEDQQLKIKGEMINPSEHPISINQGWNAIAYMLNTSMSLKDALASINPIEGDYIKGRTGYAEFDGEEWFGDLSTMIPGEGYMFKNSSDEVRTLTYSYPTYSYPTRGTNTEAKANVTTDGNHWIPSSSQFANNMTMTAMLDHDGANYEVAAFVDGECRGSARPIYVEALDSYILFLTIHGDEVEEMTFKYYDIDTDTEYTLSDRINYSNNAILGSLKEPYMFTRGTTGIGEAELSQLNIYPNPTTTTAEINLNATFDKVEVFNALGVKIAEYSNVDSIDALETAGIYVIRATNNSVISHCRLVVK